MVIQNPIQNSLVQFGYGVNGTPSAEAGFISFDSGKQAIYVGDGSTANLVTSSVKDATFAGNVLTVTKIDGTSFTLNFTDVASAKETMAVFTALETRLNNLDSSVSGLNTSLGSLAESVSLADASIRTDFAKADASLAERIKDLEDDTTVDTKVTKVTAAVTDNVVIFAAGGEVKDSGIKVGTDTLTAKESANASTLATEKAVRDAIDAVSAGAVVSISADSTNLVYTITQGGAQVGTINIPKDMVVESGTVVTNPEGQPEGTYIKLVLKNVTDPLYINVSTLIEYVTSGSAAGDMVVINVSDDHKVTATITDGTVTKAKLSADVQTSLGKADTAVQSVTTGTTNGTIKVDNTDVAVAGLGTAAYKADTYFATPADASNAETAAKTYADAIKVNGQAQSNQEITINGTHISVGGSAVYNDKTIAEAIAALDASVQEATAAGVTSFSVDTYSSDYADVDKSTGAISFKIKTIDVSTATIDNTGLADAYSVKYYVDDTKTAIVGTSADASTATTVYGAKAHATALNDAMDTRVTATENSLTWKTLE